MKEKIDECYGCFGASFNDCENCVKNIVLNEEEIEMRSDLHKEDSDGKEEVL